MKKAFITGISTGIGRATAERFLELGWQVIGSARRSSDVEDLQLKYPEQFIVWICDLSSEVQVESLAGFLQSRQINQIDILINNAGVARAAPFEHQNFQEIKNMIQVNVLAVLRVTQIITPFLKSNQGRIINISSVSGKTGTPFLAAYCASKHAIEGFSESLRREMKVYGIKVIIIGPGSVKTPIWSKGFSRNQEGYSNTDFASSFEKFLSFGASEEQNALPVSVVVSDIMHASLSKYPRRRYAPIPRKIRNRYLTQWLPAAVVDYLVCKALDLKKLG